MDVFKLKTGFEISYPIVEQTFTALTGKKKPYYQVKKDGSKSCFAVCPQCDNPIQIIGLYKNTPEAGQKPYGKHIPKSTPDLADYHQDDYNWCPLASSNRNRINGTLAKRNLNGERVKRILSFLRDNFDVVIQTVSEAADLRISAHNAEAMLTSYIGDEAWSYRTSSGENNIPWVMAEADIAHPMYGQFIRKDSELYRAIERKCSEISMPQRNEADRFVQIQKSGTRFIDLHYHFMSHELVATEDGEHVEERICFRVTRGHAPNLEEIYRNNILIDTNQFVRRCQEAQTSGRRNDRLLEIARSVIDPYLLCSLLR